jgi:hypothetical protein
MDMKVTMSTNEFSLVIDERNAQRGQNWSQNLDEDLGLQGRNETGEAEAIRPGGEL